jgi:hypothetical protein
MAFRSYWKEITEMAEMAVEVDRDTFEREVLGPVGVVLVDFWGLSANHV